MLSADIALPRGVNDFLPDTSAKIAHIEGKIRKTFDLWGFRRVITPKLEFDDVLDLGMGEGLKGKSYRFEDRQTGRLLAFPPDITPQIARIVAARLSDLPLPHRLSYSGRVLRQTEIQTGRSREIFQSGVELIGLDSPEADAEMIAMAVEALSTLGFTGFKIDIGQVEYCRGIMDSAGLAPDAMSLLKSALSRKDSSEAAALLDANNVSGDLRNEILSLSRLFGGREILDDAESNTRNPRSLAALANLRTIVEILDFHGITEHLTFDLGETRGMDYHTGITFEGFVPGLGEPVCSGGRYDSLIARYGFDAPSTGFTFNVLALLHALENTPEIQSSTEKDFLLFNSGSDRRFALDLARRLRGCGFSVARDIIRRGLDDSVVYARKMSIRYLLLVDADSSAGSPLKVIRSRDGKTADISADELDNTCMNLIEKKLGGA